MTSKRKREEVDASESKRPRRRLRSNSEPHSPDADQAEKRVALKRLFGRVCSVEVDSGRQRASSDSESDSGDASGDGSASSQFGDENEDPLLDEVPVDMDPEQLGFLVCAQETLRFLQRRGISVHNPMFARLRSRFLRGISEMGLA